MHLIHLIKSVDNRAVNIDNGHDLAVNHNGHHNLALTVAVAGNVTRELIYIRHELSLFSGGSGTADAATETDCLASDLALERAKDELRLSRALVENIEAFLLLDGIRYP